MGKNIGDKIYNIYVALEDSAPEFGRWWVFNDNTQYTNYDLTWNLMHWTEFCETEEDKDWTHKHESQLLDFFGLMMQIPQSRRMDMICGIRTKYSQEARQVQVKDLDSFLERYNIQLIDTAKVVATNIDATTGIDEMICPYCGKKHKMDLEPDNSGNYRKSIYCSDCEHWFICQVEAIHEPNKFSCYTWCLTVEDAILSPDTLRAINAGYCRARQNKDNARWADDTWYVRNWLVEIDEVYGKPYFANLANA